MLFARKQVICFMKHLLLVLSLFLFVTANSQVAAPTVPDFTFFKSNKIPFTNKDLDKNKILFFVFFDTECDHCQHAIQYLSQHQKDLGKAAVYLISLDNQEKVATFLSKNGNNLSSKKNIIFLQDAQNEFIRKFGPKKYPSLFLYSAQKKLILYDDDEKKLPVFFEKIKAYR